MKVLCGVTLYCQTSRYSLTRILSCMWPLQSFVTSPLEQTVSYISPQFPFFLIYNRRLGSELLGISPAPMFYCCADDGNFFRYSFVDETCPDVLLTGKNFVVAVQSSLWTAAVTGDGTSRRSHLRTKCIEMYIWSIARWLIPSKHTWPVVRFISRRSMDSLASSTNSFSSQNVIYFFTTYLKVLRNRLIYVLAWSKVSIIQISLRIIQIWFANCKSVLLL